MPALVLPLTLEPGADLLSRIRQMSADEFYFFCQENSEYQFERDAAGNVTIMGQTGGETGQRNSELTAELVLWNRQTGLGVVFDSSTGFALPGGAVRSPDAAWVSNARPNALKPEQRRKFPPICPDFVVELMRESDALKPLDAKLRESIDAGSQLGWLIDANTQITRIYRANGSVDVVTGFDHVVTGEDVLPGFAFDLRLLR